MTIVDNYNINADGIIVRVDIEKIEDVGLLYKVNIPQISRSTLVLLNEVKNRLITEVNVGAHEILDPKIIENLKERFKKSSEAVFRSIIPNIPKETVDFLTGTLLHEMLGLDEMEFLLNDDSLEEIVITSSSEPVRVYHKKYGWLQTNITIKTELKIQNYANTIARRVGRQITTLSPLLDAHLVTGDRANAVLYPISNKGNTITIRKFARDPWTVTDLIKNNTCSSEIFALIWLAIQYEMNILISGGTASGKTSMLNVCMPFMPPNHRIISIEDTRELQLPKFLYWVPLTVRQPNPEGKGEVTMLDLLVNSLRMRPDRIILGEIRKHDQAEVLFEAMHTGHSVYATVHANSISETIRRLVNPPINVPKNLLGAVNLNAVMFRDRRKALRRLYQLGEFIVEENEEIRPNILYRWKPSNDTFVQHAESIHLFEDLSVHTGMTIQELAQDLKEKNSILRSMAKKNIRTVDQVGEIMNKYYVGEKQLQ
ncbi:MAG: ATPase, T2SS/T4P/T4SS family [Nanoarchaeota archaeon]